MHMQRAGQLVTRPLNCGVRQHGRHIVDSPTHFAISVVPAVLLLALGLTRSLWAVGWKEVPTTALGLGVSLLVLLVAVSAKYEAGVETVLAHGPEVLFASLCACYAASLLFLARSQEVKPTRLAILGLLGLLPGYFLAGFTLVWSACGLDTTAGC